MKKKYKRRELKVDNGSASMFRLAAKKEKKMLKPGTFYVFQFNNWLVGTV